MVDAMEQLWFHHGFTQRLGAAAERSRIHDNGARIDYEAFWPVNHERWYF